MGVCLFLVVAICDDSRRLITEAALTPVSTTVALLGYICRNTAAQLGLVLFSRSPRQGDVVGEVEEIVDANRTLTGSHSIAEVIHSISGTNQY
jgi:hypothetical protein